MLLDRMRTLRLRLAARSYAFRSACGWFYLRPDRDGEPAALTPNAEPCASSLEHTGLARFSRSFADIAEYLDQSYFGPLEQGQTPNAWVVENFNGRRGMETGQTLGCYLSFRDPKLAEIFLNPDLLGIFQRYYRRQPYYRNYPVINKIAFDSEHRIDITGKFHRDGGWRQLSCMLLVTDVSLSDTHMEYALGSHRGSDMKNLDRFSYDDKVIEDHFAIEPLIGPKGTLFVFDAGNGFHRARFKAGSVRKILHLNFTTGHSVQRQRFDRAAEWSGFTAHPPLITRAFSKLLD